MSFALPERDDHWIITYTGKRFWPLAPRAADVDINDIAHALSNICRFNGHCKEFYSVAQHSVILSEHCDPENAMWGLLHDAAEAYIGDMSRPLKLDKSYSRVFRNVETNLMRVICEKFGLGWKEPDQVKELDRRILITEKEQLTIPTDFIWTEIQGTGIPLPIQILDRQRLSPWEPKIAKSYFLMRYEALCLKQSKSAI